MIRTALFCKSNVESAIHCDIRFFGCVYEIFTKIVQSRFWNNCEQILREEKQPKYTFWPQIWAVSVLTIAMRRGCPDFTSKFFAFKKNERLARSNFFRHSCFQSKGSEDSSTFSVVSFFLFFGPFNFLSWNIFSLFAFLTVFYLWSD